MTVKAHTYYIIFWTSTYRGETSPSPPWRRHWVRGSCVRCGSVGRVPAPVTRRNELRVCTLFSDDVDIMGSASDCDCDCDDY